MLPLLFAGASGGQPLGSGGVEAAAVGQGAAHQLQRILACSKWQWAGMHAWLAPLVGGTSMDEAAAAAL